MRRPRALGAALLSGAAVLGLAAQGRIFFRDTQHNLVLREFTKASSLRTEGNRIVFGGEGDPLFVDMNSQGLVLQARTLQGSAVQGADRTYVLEAATLGGGAIVTVDTAARARWQATQGRQVRPSLDQSLTRIESDTLTYRGSASEGEAKAPGKVALRVESRGSLGAGGQRNFEQILTIDATSATVALDPRAEGPSTVKTATFEGPLTYRIVRTERLPGGLPPEVTTIDGKADRLVATLVGDARQIVATGNVFVKADGPAYSGEATAASATVKLDDTLKPVMYDFSGQPATTRVRTGGGR